MNYKGYTIENWSDDYGRCWVVLTDGKDKPVFHRETKRECKAWIDRQSEKRNNPSLVILSNPDGISRARKAWSKFHLTDGSRADVREMPDIPGVPRAVMVLGAFEGGEWASRRVWVANKQSHNGPRNIKTGPWLVADSEMKRLWVVAKNPNHLLDYKRFNGAVMVAIYYFPGNPKSGKFHRTMAYRHAFGEFWADEKPKPKWAERWPKFKFIGPRAIEITPVPGKPYKIEEDGIVG